MRIVSGTGNTAEAGVDSKNRLLVKSTSEPVFQGISDVDEEAFSFYSTYAATAGDQVIYIKNIHTNKHLHIQNVIVTSDVATGWTLSEVTAGIAAGSTITAKNLNLSSGNVAQATAFGNAAVTGITATEPISHIASTISGTEFFNLRGGLIISANDEIAIAADATGTVHVTILGFYEEQD